MGCRDSFYVVGFGKIISVVTGGRMSAPTTPTTVNPCSRNVATANATICISNRLPVSPTANTFPNRSVADRAHRSVRGVGTILTTTNCRLSSIIGAAILLGSVTSFNTVGRICTSCFANIYPTHDTFRITTLPGSTHMRVRTITTGWARASAIDFLAFPREAGEAHLGERRIIGRGENALL